MATDATGTPTSPDSIPTYNTSADAPSGLGFNAAMAAIQTALDNHVDKPSGIASGEVPVWNGSAWVRSSVTRVGPASLGSGTPSATTELRGDGSWAAAHIPYAVKVRRDTNNLQSIPNNTGTDVIFDTADIEVGATSLWDSATPTRITFPIAGVWAIGARVFWAANATGYRELNLIHNNTSGVAYHQVLPSISNGNAPHMQVAGIHSFSASDYLTCRVQQNSGGALDVNAGDGNFYAAFWAYLIRAS